MDALTVILIGIGVALLAYTIRQTTAGAFDSIGDLMSTEQQSGSNYTPGLIQMARAIATAEGFYVAGSIPATYHNPGDLKLGDVGFGVGPTGITKFGSDDQGFAALYAQLERIANGTTHAGYTLDMTFEDMAIKWAEGDHNWAVNVSASLGVSSDTQIGMFLT